jgi:predicted nucleic acid-binding protein
MKLALLDTTVASLFHPRKKASTLLPLYESVLLDTLLVISFQSVAELWAWPYGNKDWPKNEQQRQAFTAFLHKFIVIEYEPDLAEACAVVSAYAKAKGKRLEWGDAWVMATAVFCSLPLVTHDRDQVQVDFPGLQIISFLER